MKFKEFTDPVPHIIISDFYDRPEEAYKEAIKYMPNIKPGLYTVNGISQVNPVKKNNVIFLDTSVINRNSSYILKFFKTKYWDGVKKYYKSRQNPLYELSTQTNVDQTQLSYYGDGDGYGYHIDLVNNSPITVISFINKIPKMFTGGNIILKRNGIKKTIRFKYNTALIMPSSCMHSVTPIKMKSKKGKDKRISIQYWAGYK